MRCLVAVRLQIGGERRTTGPNGEEEAAPSMQKGAYPPLSPSARSSSTLPRPPSRSALKGDLFSSGGRPDRLSSSPPKPSSSLKRPPSQNLLRSFLCRLDDCTASEPVETRR
jgi:hypothetical protein